MAKGKRVSNKSGGDPGKRSSKTRERPYYQNVARRKIRAAQDRALFAPNPKTIGPSGIPTTVRKPSRFARAISTFKRFFRSK